MYGGQASGLFTRSMVDLSIKCTRYGIPMRFYSLFNESLIPRARNYIVDEFLRSEASHFIFIDSDIGFNADDVIAMMAIQISDPDKYNVVTAPYNKKTIAWEKVKLAVNSGKVDNPFDLPKYAGDFVLNQVEGKTNFRLDEPVQVQEAGTGFMMITRNTLETYSDTFPEYKYFPDHIRSDNFDGSREITAFFDCVIDPDSRRYLSEDYFFCRNITKIGMKVWMCPWMELIHVGSYNYSGTIAALGSLGESLTASEKSKTKNYTSSKNRKKRAFRP